MPTMFRPSPAFGLTLTEPPATGSGVASINDFVKLLIGRLRELAVSRLTVWFAPSAPWYVNRPVRAGAVRTVRESVFWKWRWNTEYEKKKNVRSLPWYSLGISTGPPMLPP